MCSDVLIYYEILQMQCPLRKTKPNGHTSLHNIAHPVIFFFIRCSSNCVLHDNLQFQIQYMNSTKVRLPSGH